MDGHKKLEEAQVNSRNWCEVSGAEGNWEDTRRGNPEKEKGKEEENKEQE